MAEYKKVSLRDLMSKRDSPDTKTESTLKVSDEIQRRDVVFLGDENFFDKTVFSFNNNKYVNAFFINEVKDKEYSDFFMSNNVVFNTIESCISLKNVAIDGYYMSTEVCTDKGYKADLNDFFLIVDEDIPLGCDILYHIVTNDNRVFPIKPNATTPLTFTTKAPTSFRLRATLVTNGTDTPRIRAYAVLYHDSFVEYSYGLVEPDLSKGDYDGLDDIITLVRDNTNEDKLVEVISRLNTVKLTYDVANDNRLEKVEQYSNLGNRKESENNLIYGDYLNSKGEIEEVLLQVTEKTQFK